MESGKNSPEEKLSITREETTIQEPELVKRFDIDSSDKWYLINTNRFFESRRIRHYQETRNDIEFTVTDFGHNYEDRFVSNFKIYTDSSGRIYEYKKEADSLSLYSFDMYRMCDTKTLLWIDSLMSLRRLNEKDIYLLIKSVNPYCKNNVEYSQMVNEYLWKSLMNNPQKFAFAFGIENISIEQKQFVIAEISSPLHDTFRPSDLIDSIQSSKMNFRDSNAVKLLIQALKTVELSYE